MELLTPNRRPGRQVSTGDRPSEPAPTAARVRMVLVATLGPLATGYAAVAALLGLVTASASVASFSVPGVLRAAGPGWLAAYQVPIMISGRPLGVLPLAATFAMGVLVARSAAHAARRLGYREPGEAVNLVAPMAAGHALLGMSIALLSRNAVVSAEPLAAFLTPGLIAAFSATLGLARCCGLINVARQHLDPVAIRGLRAGALGAAGLLAVGVLVVTLSLALSMPTVSRLFAASAPGFGSSFGMLLLSLGYFPNAVVCALSFAAGPGFSIGSVPVGPFSFAGGVVPGVPLLAGIPEHKALWWPILLVFPAAVGALVGWFVRDSDASLSVRLRIVGIAGVLIAFGCVPLGGLAGGRLGAGPFDPVTVPVGLLSLAAFGWTVLSGGLVAWLAGPRPPVVIVPDEIAIEAADDADADDGDDAAEQGAEEAMEDGAMTEAEETAEPAEPEESDTPLSEDTGEEPEADKEPPDAETPDAPG